MHVNKLEINVGTRIDKATHAFLKREAKPLRWNLSEAIRQILERAAKAQKRRKSR